MRLLRAELGRALARRAVVVVGLVAFVLGALLLTSAAYETRPATDVERQAAEQMLDRTAEDAQRELARCQADPEAFGGGGADSASCEDLRPTIDWFLPRPTLDLEREREGRGTAVLLMLAATAVLVGATFAGADWTSGYLGHQLLFEPRRTRMWAVKALAVCLVTTVWSAVVVTGFWAGLWLLASGRDIPVDDATLGAVVATAGRGLALVAAASVGGFALTMLLRHTGATLGLLFGYAVVGEVVVATLPFEGIGRFSLAQNIRAWLLDGAEVFDPRRCTEASEACNPYLTLTLGQSAIYLAVLLAIAATVSILSFRSRDVA